MKKPTNDPVQQWKTLLACCDDDLLDPDYPEPLVDAELRQAGLDPKEVGREGEAFVKRLLAERAEAASRSASRTRLRSSTTLASSSPPAKATLSTVPPVRSKAPSETGPIDD